MIGRASLWAVALLIDLVPFLSQPLIQVGIASIGAGRWGVGSSTRRRRPFLSDYQLRFALRQVDDITFTVGAQIDTIDALGEFAGYSNSHLRPCSQQDP